MQTKKTKSEKRKTKSKKRNKKTKNGKQNTKTKTENRKTKNENLKMKNKKWKRQKKTDNWNAIRTKNLTIIVFQGKKTLIKGPKSKKNSIIRRNNTVIYEKKLSKPHFLSALKFEEVSDNSSRFVWNDI